MTIKFNVREIFAMESPVEIKLNGELDSIPDSNTIYVDAKTKHKAAVALAEFLIESSSKISRKRLGEIATEQFQKMEAGAKQ